MIQAVIGQGGRRASRPGGGARGEVAPTIVLGSIGLRLAAGGRAGGAGRVEPGELVGLAAVTIQVGPCAIVGALPQLAQVCVDVAVAVAGSGQAVVRPTATGATACRRGCPGVARPHQPIVLVVAERFGLAAPRIGGVRHGCLHGGQTGHVTRRVVGTRLTEDRAAGAAVGPPGGRRAGGAQVGIVLELLGCQRPVCPSGFLPLLCRKLLGGRTKRSEEGGKLLVWLSFACCPSMSIAELLSISLNRSRHEYPRLLSEDYLSMSRFQNWACL